MRHAGAFGAGTTNLRHSAAGRKASLGVWRRGARNGSRATRSAALPLGAVFHLLSFVPRPFEQWCDALVPHTLLDRHLPRQADEPERVQKVGTNIENSRRKTNRGQCSID